MYLLLVYNELTPFCSSVPRLVSSVRLGKRHYGLEFFSRALPCFTELYSLFYPNGVKIVPHNIYDLLTPVALAHMIMGDGQWSRHGLILCTNSYTIEEIVRLMNVLMVRYNLECNIREFSSNKKIEHMIYIKHSSMPLLRSIVKSHVYPSMQYKLHNCKASEYRSI